MRHPADQVPDFFGKSWAPRLPTLAHPSPVIAELFLLPGDHCTRLYVPEGGLPAWPESGQPGPEDAIGRVETRAVDSLLADGHLVLEGENL